MDIKLRARLCAYSRITELEPNIPEKVTDEQIDDLFTNMDVPTSVTKDEIDNLFTEQEAPKSVTKADIDNLFANSEDKPESVQKDTIDTLFDETATDNVTSVTFAEIDSLFR